MTETPAHGYRAGVRGSAATLVPAGSTAYRVQPLAAGCSRVVAPDGTLFAGGRHGTSFAVAVSHDEGHTWRIRPVPGSRVKDCPTRLHSVLLASYYALPNPVAVDDDGTIYAVWPDPRGTLYAAWSADGGLEWSQPVVVSAPTVRSARLAAVAATGSGRVAVAYYAREKGRATRGFVAQTKYFTAPNPVFVGEWFDDVVPSYSYRSVLAAVLSGNTNDILSVRFSSDGTPIVSPLKRTIRGR